MSAGPSLYRRHRPRTFADVIGQEHVVRTLRNAIGQDAVHHAYLFVGSRGTGKTSMAKMLAACLNCVDGPTVEPCGVCESCVSIASATSMDVIEMDAASNNSVDDIRELRDSVQYAPVTGRYKVYILDEAHMLSSAAWNAFLKTLEEPPPSTIFVLATTEAHKIMDTVVDRCHRFDFRRPTVEQLATVVQRVAGKESIEIAPEAVALVARNATGSYRDALGTLEQLVTYSGAAIATEDVLAVLGVADDDLLFGALDAIAAHDARAAWQVAARLADSGREPAQFLKDLETHARDVLVTQTLGEVPPQLAITAERDARLADQAARMSGADSVRLLDLLAAGMRLAKDGADAQTQLEVALVKAAAPEVDPSTRALLARMERMEAALRGGAPVAAAPAGAQPPAAPAAQSVPAPVAAAPAVPAPPSSSPPAAPAPAPVGPSGADLSDPTGPPLAEEQPSAPARSDAVSSSRPTGPPEPARAPVAEAAVPELVREPTAVAVAEPPAPIGELDLAMVQELWPAVLQNLAESNQLLAGCLAEARPMAVSGREITLAFTPECGFQKKKAEGAAERQLLTAAFKELTGIAPRLLLETRDTEELGAEPEVLGEDDFIARLRAEFDAVDHQPDQEDQEQA
ncbi:DNA polymerase III subunit gamma/tau [Baekduia sp.]|uniref:DNA polymerase III subunit gamma/tau n=1 Tax=Baekduia sp. TaxID=2600305 RepID=UPI002E0B1C01|nr:DNA polymerase III subunit gamma/tau [Baekduia sp.]